MLTLHLTADAVLAAYSAALSLFFAYFPGVSAWYDRLDDTLKPALQLGLIAAAVLVYAFFACNFIAACLVTNWIEIGGVFLACLTTNHMTYVHAVRQIKAKAAARRSDPTPPAPLPPAPVIPPTERP